MIDGRKRTSIRPVAGLALAACLGGLGLHLAAPASAEPKLEDVQKKVDRLYHQAEIASENYNAAKIQLTDSRDRLTTLRKDLAKQQRVVDSMRGGVASMMVQQYHGQDLSTASQVVFAKDQQRFVDNLNAASSYSSQQATAMSDYDAELASLALRKKAADEQVAALDKTEDVLRKQKSVVDSKAAEAKTQLDSLKAAERARMSAADNGAAFDGPLPAASGRAGAAVRYALAQVGDSYVWGASGPNAFDCSGLMMAAWGQAGVGLPHQSGAQMGSGTPVSRDQLQPGDLVFYYSPVSHVGMYIGNGKIVHAANPRSGVEVSPVDSMPYSGATRVG
ncbi:hypothetical protein GCM10011519_01090 [Marmoricola endophyticus]|uniref:NlpC/P60 domain-containing protein n=1 Tax=Marmoricola endophyticus TaxID=2040280 RepID=A0A917BCA9_9ACTN|nr:C40 family peptidase [Marmoricola endophyticus]GGF31522.1 hypothetical protein GCM10011519_01090 [Marmoricola endophyticus]